jgi:hypothetical protein
MGLFDYHHVHNRFLTDYGTVYGFRKQIQMRRNSEWWN